MKRLCLCRVGGEWASKQPAAMNQGRVSSPRRGQVVLPGMRAWGPLQCPFFALDNDIRQHVKRPNAMYINLLALIVF